MTDTFTLTVAEMATRLMVALQLAENNRRQPLDETCFGAVHELVARWARQGAPVEDIRAALALATQKLRQNLLRQLN